jgi:putative hydrolase of the HAD superfamily
MKKIFAMMMLAMTMGFAEPVVVFDFGGVLTGKMDREAIVQFLCDSFSLSEEEFDQVNVKKRAAIKAGKSDEEFWLSYAQEKEIELPSSWPADFAEVMKSSLGVNPEMYQLVEELKGNAVRVALFSNVDERLANLLRKFGYYEPFDTCLLSCEIAAQKPDPASYEVLLKTLDVPAGQIVFIDDREENVEGAKQKEIDAFLFQSVEHTRGELAKRGLLRSLESDSQKSGNSLNIQ